MYFAQFIITLKMYCDPVVAVITCS